MTSIKLSKKAKVLLIHKSAKPAKNQFHKAVYKNILTLMLPLNNTQYSSLNIWRIFICSNMTINTDVEYNATYSCTKFTTVTVQSMQWQYVKIKFPYSSVLIWIIINTFTTYTNTNDY